ncbi:MAG: hypothetical protein IJN11_05485 [Oscillospiraceae bacterium]|nr:hypothetical protein [Oscillospiraceae bacterium]
MTDREKAIAMAYTGICFLQGDKLGTFYEYVRELLGKPVYTHELPKYLDELKEKSRPDFMRLCEEDTKPITHARWEKVGEIGSAYRCTNCRSIISMYGSAQTPDAVGWYHCNHCGAKMDGAP